jgi:SAM-dependent methyltransferase
MERSVYDNMRVIEDEHWWFRARREILSDQLQRLNLTADARILEVGCGTGGNLRMLSRFGGVTGMEPDEPSRAYAEKVAGVPVLSGFLPRPLPEFGAPFDLIAALDVIEHLEDDEGSVVALANLLKPKGRMLTTVPAHPWMWSQHDVAHHHKRRYREAEYLKLFDAAGLRILKASYFNSILFPPIALVRLLKLGAQDGKAGGDEAVPVGPLNRLLTGVFGLEKILLRAGRLPFGVSLLVIAEKSA